MTFEWQVLDAAHTALLTAVKGAPVESYLLTTPCDRWNVAQVAQHAAGDQMAYGAVVNDGSGFPDFDPFAPSAIYDGDLVALVERGIDSSAAAFAKVAPGTEIAIPIPIGPVTAHAGVGAAATDAAVHAWDIAVATGQTSPLTPDLARELLPSVRTIAEPIRAFGMLAAPLAPVPGDDDLALLLRYLGRLPR